MKKIFSVLTLLFVSMLATAQTPQGFQPPHQEPVCPTGCIITSSGQNYIEARLGPSFDGTENGFAFQLPFNITVRRLEAWIGTTSGDQFEQDARLQYLCPGDVWGEYYLQFDKHMDVVGDMQRGFDVNIPLTTSCAIWIYHSAAGKISCPNGCGYDISWRIYSN